MTGDLKAQVSYLKGLSEGLALDEESKEGKMFGRIVDLLDEMAQKIDQLKSDYEELFEYTEALDEDLSDLEDDFYEEDDVDDDDDDDDYECFSVECPQCGKMVEVGEDLLHTDDAVKVTCPCCGEVVLVDDDDWEDADLDDLLEGAGEELEGEEEE